MFDSSKDNQLELGDIGERLASEKIDLEFQIAMKRLFQCERRLPKEGALDFAKTVGKTLDMALCGDKHEELEHICLSLRRGMRRLMQRDSRRVRAEQGGFEVFQAAINPSMAAEIAMRSPQAALVLCQVAKEMPDSKWRHMFGGEFLDFTFRKYHLTEMIERGPDAWIAWLPLMREFGGGRFLERHGGKMLPPEFFERALEPRRLLDICEHNPEAALALLQLARELGGEHFRKNFNLERFEVAFNNPLAARRLREKPTSFAVMLRLVYRSVKTFTLKRMGKVEFLPTMHSRRVIDFFNTQHNSLLEFLFGIYTDVFQERSGHLSKECLHQV